MGTEQSWQDPAEEPRKPIARRNVLRRAAAGVLGGAVAAFGLTRPAAAADRSEEGRNPHLSGQLSTWHAYCCDLLYGLCTSTQKNNCKDKWSWTCCAYVGSYLQRVTCGECNTYACSWYAFGAAC